MVITQGSLFNFQIVFKIPRNTKFARIQITDTLANGLKYNIQRDETDAVINTPAEITSTISGDIALIEQSTVDPAAPYDYTDDSLVYTNESTPQQLEFNITSLEQIQFSTTNTELNTITVSVPVSGEDATALLEAQEAVIAAGEEFKNTATIIAYDANGNPISTIRPDEPLDFTNCQIFGLGGGISIPKSEAKDVELLYDVKAIGSSTNPNLQYEMTVTLPNELDLVTPDDPITDISFSIEDKDGSTIILNNLLTDTAIYEPISKVLTIRWDHLGIFSEKMVRVTIDTITNEAIETYAGDSLFVPADYDVLYRSGEGDLTVSCSADTFDFSIRFGAELTGGNKDILIVI